MPYQHMTSANWGQSGTDSAAAALEAVTATDRPLTGPERGRLVGVTVMGTDAQQREAQRRLDADVERRANSKRKRQDHDGNRGGILNG